MFGYRVPIGSMYGIFTYIYRTNQPNVGKYTIHGWYGVYSHFHKVIITFAFPTFSQTAIHQRSSLSAV